MTDKRIVNIFSISVFFALLIALILPFSGSGRYLAAVLLLPASILIYLFVKKRSTLATTKRQILLIMSVFALVFVTLYYLSGLRFGFYNNPYKLSVGNFFSFFLPVAIIIFSTELIRYVMMAQKGRAAKVLCYFSCVFADILIVSSISNITTFGRFMEVFAGALFPALLSNLLFAYLTTRYGFYPNLAYRAITTLHAYALPITSGISPALEIFCELISVIIVFLFIDTLFERKRRFALGNPSPLWRFASKALTVVVVIMMLSVVMLVSNQFRYGSLVIATESMTGELNKGDVIIYESYDKHNIPEGQVIVFEKNDSVVVHRVVDIKIINGVKQYYTKGDANEHNDTGFITDSDIVGLVNYKLPFIGYPTLWMRSLFKR